MTDYLPISPLSLKTDTVVGCDLYLQTEVSSETRFILYCKATVVFEKDKKELLMAKKINRLFIKLEEQQTFYDYLERNFQEVIKDTQIHPDEKTKIVHGAATNLLKDLFTDTKTENTNRSQIFAHNMVDYLLSDNSAAHSMLTMAVHEYNTYVHSVNVAAVGTLFAQKLGMGMSELKGLCSGILIHDIGKTRVDPNIINKDGQLTKEEFEEVKKHPELGIDILNETGTMYKEERIIILQHHENDDGTGYPYGLKKDEIHQLGKIARIIDVYDALTANRPYAKAIRPFAALVEMKKTMLNSFDNELFREFICFLGPYEP